MLQDIYFIELSKKYVAFDKNKKGAESKIRRLLKNINLIIQ